MAGARGEGTIYAESGEVHVLYTNWTLTEIEKATGKSILAIADGFARNETTLTDVAHILRFGMETHRRDARIGGQIKSLRDALDVLDEVGFSKVTAAVMESVAYVLGYGAGQDGEEDPNA